MRFPSSRRGSTRGKIAGLLALSSALFSSSVRAADPCKAIVDVLEANRKNDDKSIYFPAKLAYDCLNALPLNQEYAQQTADGLLGFHEVISYQTYFKNPPTPELEIPVHDGAAEIQKIKDKVKNGKYKGFYEFGSDVYKVFLNYRDGHTAFLPDVLHSFSYAHPYSIVSVADNPTSEPKIWTLNKQRQLDKQVTEINGQPVMDYLVALANSTLENIGFADPDTRFNALLSQFPTVAPAEREHMAYFQFVTVYPGVDKFTMKFADGSTQEVPWMARLWSEKLEPILAKGVEAFAESLWYTGQDWEELVRRWSVDEAIEYATSRGWAVLEEMNVTHPDVTKTGTHKHGPKKPKHGSKKPKHSGSAHPKFPSANHYHPHGRRAITKRDVEAMDKLLTAMEKRSVDEDVYDDDTEDGKGEYEDNDDDYEDDDDGDDDDDDDDDDYDEGNTTLKPSHTKTTMAPTKTPTMTPTMTPTETATKKEEYEDDDDDDEDDDEEDEYDQDDTTLKPSHTKTTMAPTKTPTMTPTETATKKEEYEDDDDDDDEDDDEEDEYDQDDTTYKPSGHTKTPTMTPTGTATKTVTNTHHTTSTTEDDEYEDNDDEYEDNDDEEDEYDQDDTTVKPSAHTKTPTMNPTKTPTKTPTSEDDDDDDYEDDETSGPTKTPTVDDDDDEDDYEEGGTPTNPPAPTKTPNTDDTNTDTKTGQEKGYPEYFNTTSDGMMRFYSLDGETAVLDVSSFSVEDVVEASSMLDHGLDYITSVGHKYLIIDLTNNGGGDAFLPFDFARMLFPKKYIFESVNMRYTKANYVALKNLPLGALWTTEDKNWTSIEEIFRPVDRDGDKFTQMFKYDHLEITQQNGHGVDPKQEQPFPPENIVVLGNGHCGSACFAFYEALYRHGVRSYAMGGRPNKSKYMQTSGGIKGGVVYPFENYINMKKFYEAFDDERAQKVAKILPGPLRLRFVGALNVENQFRNGEEDQLPLEFRYTAACKRFSWTKEMMVDTGYTWKFIRKQAWDKDGKPTVCEEPYVPKKEYKPSNTTTSAPSTTAQHKGMHHKAGDSRIPPYPPPLPQQGVKHLKGSGKHQSKKESHRAGPHHPKKESHRAGPHHPKPKPLHGDVIPTPPNRPKYGDVTPTRPQQKNSIPKGQKEYKYRGSKSKNEVPDRYIPMKDRKPARKEHRRKKAKQGSHRVKKPVVEHYKGRYRAHQGGRP